MTDRLKVVIAGINGRMGIASARLILGDPQLELVGAFGTAKAAYVGKDVGSLTHGATTGILVSNSIEDLKGQNSSPMYSWISPLPTPRLNTPSLRCNTAFALSSGSPD